MREQVRYQLQGVQNTIQHTHKHILRDVEMNLQINTISTGQ